MSPLVTPGRNSRAEAGVEAHWAVKRSAGVGHHSPLLGWERSAGTVDTVGVAAVGPAGALADQSVAAVGPADDRLGAGGGLAGMAFAVQLDHHVGAQDGVLLLAADPLEQLGR
jgi:hypothetical protein